MKRYDDLIIAQVGYVANVPYFLTYALMSKGFESINLLPEDIVNSKFAKIFYGSRYNGNPLNVRLIPIKGTGLVYINKLAHKFKYFSREKFLIAHLHIGSALRDHLFLWFLEKLYKKKIKLAFEFHGTDLRNLSSSKAKFLRYIYNTFLVSTPDLITYCEALELPCMWLPNVVDPYYILFIKNKIENIIYNKKHNIEKGLIKVLIPTRLDEHKNLQLFYEMLSEAVKNIDFYIHITHIVWPETVDAFINRVLPTYKHLTKNKNIKFKVLPLQNRYDLLSLYLDSNVVIGQFKLGILSLTELEALATLNHVIMSRLNVRTKAVYSSEVPVCSINDSSELGKCFDRIISEPANLSGLEFIERYHSIEKVINMLLSYYYNVIHW
ncbi:hypothetical protein TUZN_0011 [Thermoproteus uzoniensis 768-20]|uniref:Glycosyltransferase subfamily 4-like N-terminal domain-containing protein n=1 Tax=Thermoproteus uzoniensis (strain 768-20) TaxID=999630 RepID=F2L0N8_THEU7|nr:glycosyltransferase [Thermoproteus uzoniensis]AEA11517.1 hypothetical protein TUZN_0011 [Thermoproteus uzoniensis 768-20]